jgi:tRNA(Arg) A34 adenosine deaminase TadA
MAWVPNFHWVTEGNKPAANRGEGWGCLSSAFAGRRLLDRARAVVSWGGTAGASPLQGLLGHAQVNALAEGIPPDNVRRRDAVLYTTLHPCPMCSGRHRRRPCGSAELRCLRPDLGGH